MTKKITKNFRVHNAEQFVESFEEAANTIYYMFASRHLPWNDDNNPPNPTDSMQDTFYNIYDNMVFGKKIDLHDVAYMVDNNQWTANTVYAMYSDTDETLPDKQFFVAVSESNGYNVFKCLFNNKGLPSTVAPSYFETVADDDVYITTADNYQWKYMFNIPTATYQKFATSTKIPFVEDANVTANAIAGAVDVVVVNDGGSRYNSVANGVVKVANVAGNTLIHELESLVGANLTITTTQGSFQVERINLYGKWSNGDLVNSNGDVNSSNAIANGVAVLANNTFLKVVDVAGNFFGQTSNVVVVGETSNAFANIGSVFSTTSSISSNTDFYKGAAFYIASGTGAGQIKTVSEYIVTGSARRVVLDSDLSEGVDSTSRWEITPKVSISGDGQGAVGRAIVNTATFAIDTVEMIERGNSYTWATAQVIGNTGISGSLQANNANVHVIIGPSGGHGSNVISELYATTVGMSVDFENTESGNISVDNDIRQFGVIESPRYANVAISVANTTLVGSGASGSGFSFDIGETLYQGSNTIGTVSDRAAGTIYVSNVYGQFITSGSNTDLRIYTQNTTSNVVTANATSVLTNPGRGASNFDTFDQRLILTQFSNTSGLAFTEDEKIIQDSTDAEGYIQVINSTAVAVTNSRGNWLASEAGTFYSFRGQTSGAVGYFLGKINPDLEDNSGSILYVENIQPITRDAAQTERVKLLIEF